MMTSRRKIKARKQNFIAGALGLCITALISGFGYTINEKSKLSTPDENYCYQDDDTAVTAVFYDASMPVVESLVNQEHLQDSESPILEYIQAISRRSDFSNATKRKLIVISDLIQHRDNVWFCQNKGDLPAFSKFKQRSYFNKIKPNSMFDADVDIYMILSSYYALPYCTEDELRNFFSAYFEDAQTHTPLIHRLLI